MIESFKDWHKKKNNEIRKKPSLLIELWQSIGDHNGNIVDYEDSKIIAYYPNFSLYKYHIYDLSSSDNLLGIINNAKCVINLEQAQLPFSNILDKPKPLQTLSELVGEKHFPCLKTIEPDFTKVKEKKKTFDIRFDFGYRSEDIVIFQKFDKETNQDGDEAIVVQILYAIQGEKYGLKENYVGFSFNILGFLPEDANLLIL